MANCVLVPTHITAMDVDAYNRVGIAETDIPNGTPLVCGVCSTDADKKHVFKVTAANGAVKGVWLAYSPEVIQNDVNGQAIKGVLVDPRNFTNVANRPFDMFKPVAGVDLIQVTKEFFDDGKDPKTVAGATYVEIQADGKFDAVAEATAQFANTQFRIVQTEPIIIGNGAIGGEAVDAWILECTIN